MTSETLYDALVDFHNQLDSTPPEEHLFCPKLDDEDSTNYDEPDMAEEGVAVEEKKRRIKAGEARQTAACSLSLLMGMEEHVGSWLPEWLDRSQKFLTKCDGCVRRWHKSRGPFLRQLRE